MKFEIFRRNGCWRWRLVARNGRAIAESVPTYQNRQDCVAAIDMVMSTSPSTPVDEPDRELVGDGRYAITRSL
jgi:uncharacterized protein YegP (UPF0339 family)